MKCSTCGCGENANFYPYNKYMCKDCLSTRWGTKREKYKKTYLANYAKKNREKLREYYKNWYRENGRKRDPIKEKAHSRVHKAIKNEELIKPQECSDCRRKQKIEAHHPDYSRPLAVIWLCNRCHRYLHRGDRVVSTRPQPSLYTPLK